MATERVQKILAQAGIASRRKSEELITEGSVTINGVRAKLGDKADLYKDSIKVNGKLLKSVEPHLYIAFNKPRGVISMLADPEGRPTLADFLEKIKTRIFPVGRLDFNTDGLLLLTNDGAIAEKIQNSDEVLRIYEVKIKGHPTAETVAKLERGARIEGKLFKPFRVRLSRALANKSLIELTVKGSGGADIKTYLEMKGFLIERVTRVAIGQVTLRGVPPGAYRFLQKSQLEALFGQPELGERLLDNREKKYKLPKEAMEVVEPKGKSTRVIPPKHAVPTRLIAPRSEKKKVWDAEGSGDSKRKTREAKWQSKVRKEGKKDFSKSARGPRSASGPSIRVGSPAVSVGIKTSRTSGPSPINRTGAGRPNMNRRPTKR